MSDEATVRAALLDAGRLDALRRTGLLDTPAEEEFDRLTRLVCRLLGVPAALVSLVEADRQFLKSAIGLPEPWLLRRETTLLHSFCQHVVAAGAPLIVQDATRHPLVSENLAVADLGVVAYLGMPLTTPDGHVLGALCAIDSEPRTWLPSDAAVLRDLAAMTVAETTLRRLARAMDARAEGEAAAREAAEARAQRLEGLRRLASSLVHEFAGVMQAVQSGVRLAASRIAEDPPTAHSLLLLLGDVAQRGGALTERLRVFVTPRERRAERIDVAAFLRRVARLEPAASDPPVRTRLDLEDGLPEIVADPEELQAVMMVLTGAARAAMTEGGTLILAATLDAVAGKEACGVPIRPGRYVRIAVADSGTGADAGQDVPAGAASPDPAWQVSGAELAFAREIAEQLGGMLVREGRPGRGTTALLWLPVAGDAAP
jgi:signal transduction histidine kinase